MMRRGLLAGGLCLAAFAVAALLIGSASGAPLRAWSRYDAASANATLDADAGSLTPADASATQTSFVLGGTVTLDLPHPASVIAIAVPTTGEEAVSLLSDGGAAVTYPAPAAPDVGPVASDSTDSADPDIAAQIQQNQAHDQLPDVDTDPADQPDDTPDGTSYPGGDGVPPPVEGMSIVDDAVGQTTNGSLVAAALDPPVAVDAQGAPVSATLSFAQGGLVVSISPDASTTFPVHVTLTAGFNGDFDPATDASTVAPAGSAQVSCGASRPAIVISYVTHWQNLAGALVKKPTPCANYDVLIPAAGGGLTPRAGSPAAVAALNALPAVQKADALFRPVATFGYTGITDGQYRADGKKFARRLQALGYTTWAIDEAPASLLNGSGDPSWAHFSELVAGLSSTGLTGIIEDAIVRDDLAKDTKSLRQYKDKAETLLNSKKHGTNFDWQTINNGTANWVQEAYTYCSLVCVKSASLGAMASHTNAYMQHFGRLAFAPDAPNTVAPAQAALANRYIALTNEWKGHDNFAYQTSRLSLEQMQGLARLQVYAEKAWQVPGNAYAVPGVGVRWTDNAVNFSASDQAALAATIAASLKGAYKPDGSALKACAARGTVSRVFCEPQAGGASFSSGWSIFRRWGRRTQSVTCPGAGGADIAGGPANDNLDSAEPLSGAASDRAFGTLAGATVQNGEQLPPDQGAPDGTVWYCWTATQDAIDADVCNPGGASFVVEPLADGQADNNAYPDWISVWEGGAFGSLGLVADGLGQVNAPVVVGETYLLQIANVSGTGSVPDFELSWPLNCG